MRQRVACRGVGTSSAIKSGTRSCTRRTLGAVALVYHGQVYAAEVRQRALLLHAVGRSAGQVALENAVPQRCAELVGLKVAVGQEAVRLCVAFAGGGWVGGGEKRG